jgi:RimJ/RimL family protein N-acetyltransferase
MSIIEPRTVRLPDGESILIRAPEKRDMPAWTAYEQSMYLNDPHKVTDASEFNAGHEFQWSMLREMLDPPGGMVMVACPANRPEVIIGDLVFRSPKNRKQAHQGNFGIAIAGDHRGRGIGRVLITTLLDWAAAHPLLEKVRLHVWADNTGAIRLYERCGFRHEARTPCHFRLGPGHYVDDVQMAIWVKPGLAPPGFNTYQPAG